MHHRATHLRADGGDGFGPSSSSSVAAAGPPAPGGGGAAGATVERPLHHRYTPLATSAAAAAAAAAVPSSSSSSSPSSSNGISHHRPPPGGGGGGGAGRWERLHWALVQHRLPLLGALALLVLGLLLLGPLAQQALSALPPWKETLSSLTGICKEEEEFQRLGRALWVAGDPLPRRFGCDPSQCHCVFLLAPAEEEEGEEEEEEEGAGKKKKRAGAAGGSSNRRRQLQLHEGEEGRIRGKDRGLMGEEVGAAGFSTGGGGGGGGGGKGGSSSLGRSSSSHIRRGLVLPGGLRRVNYFQMDKPLCLIPGVRYEDLVKEHGLDAKRTTRLSKGPSLWYSSDLVNPYHIMHFRARPIFDFMLRRGLEAGQAHFIEPKPKAELPGGYGVFLMQLLGQQLWKDDYAEGSALLFDDLWVRPRGRWLYPVHSYFPEAQDPATAQGPVMYGPHVDAKWNQLARFVRRRVLGQGEVEGRKEDDDDQPRILLVDRVHSRRLLDARTGSFEEVLRVLREGGLKKVEAVRFEDISEEEQFRKVMHARVLVAVHGAALTNMAFQPPFDSSVIEIVFSPRKPDYPNLARTLGRGYHYVWAERAEERFDPNPISYRRVYVDSRKLLATIKEVIAKRKGGLPGSLCC